MTRTRPAPVARFGPRPARARRGLSLIEVMLALAILLLSIVAIGKLVDVGTDNGNRARMTTRGTRLAQAKMAEVEAGAVGLSEETTGTFPGDDSGWTFTVTPDSTGLPPNLYHVTVRVTRDLNGTQFEVAVTQLVFDPAWVGSSAQHEWPPEEEPVP